MEGEAKFAPGHVLADRYRLIERLGVGGMGEVWSAEHLALGSRVAVKVLPGEVARRPDVAARFEREARAAAALQSPHVVRVFDHGVERGTPFIAMELLQGETLARRLEAGPLEPRSTARIVTHIARALTLAHDQGIVHRDLKPENVFLVPDDDGETAKLLDFGVAKVSQEIASRAAPTRTQSGALLGTPLYMSPEQLRERPVDHRSDLWSLALVAFECATGRTAFEGGAVAEIISEVLNAPMPVPSRHGSVPEGFDAWFARAASRDPAARFASARELAEALAALVEAQVEVREEGTVLSAEREGPNVLGPPPRGRRWGTALAASAAVASLSALLLLRGAQPTGAAPSRSPAVVTAAPLPDPAPTRADPASVDAPPPPVASAAPPAPAAPSAAAAQRASKPVAPRAPATVSGARSAEPPPPPAPTPAHPLAF